MLFMDAFSPALFLISRFRYAFVYLMRAARIPVESLLMPACIPFASRFPMRTVNCSELISGWSGRVYVSARGNGELQAKCAGWLCWYIARICATRTRLLLGIYAMNFSRNGSACGAHCRGTNEQQFLNRHSQIAWHLLNWRAQAHTHTHKTSKVVSIQLTHNSCD